MQPGSILGGLCAALIVGYAGAAMAECDEYLDAADKRLMNIAKEQARSKGGGDGNGNQPTEGWFATSSSAKNAKDLLKKARGLANEGKDEGCMSMVTQANRIIDGLGGPPAAKKWDGPKRQSQSGGG